MTERPFLSIGEVLELLKAEFPDVTISKIRFLESQGLLDPERTPSGYRKFYEPDVERLRWILRQQRENFLPLKVIKGRLAEPRGEADAPPAEVTPGPDAAVEGDESGGPLRDPGLTGTSFSAEELANASGLDREHMAELERFGLLTGRVVAGQTYYDEDCLVVARLAAGFAKHGIEGRHLRMYKISADREAGFFEQVVLPLVRQRNPAARRQAHDTLAELARLGEGLRGALLRAALREHTEA